MIRNRIIIAAVALIVFSSAHAFGHSWLKMSQTNATDAFGNPVVQCVWKCSTYQHNNHTTITQGFGFCPMPY